MSAAQALPIEPPANAVRVQNWPTPPAFIEPWPVSLISYPTLEQLAARCVALLNGRPYLLVEGVAAYPPFQTFPKITVWAAGPNNRLAEWLGAAVLLSPGGPAEDRARLTAAINQMTAAAGGRQT